MARASAETASNSFSLKRELLNVVHAPGLGCSADVFNVKTRHGRLRCALLCAAAPSAAFGTRAAAYSTVQIKAVPAPAQSMYKNLDI